jgi:hypothetical protein
MVQKSSSWEEVRNLFTDSSKKSRLKIWVVARGLVDATFVHGWTNVRKWTIKTRVLGGLLDMRV